MASKKSCLGIHYTEDCITAVLVRNDDGAYKLGDALKLELDNGEEGGTTLIEQLKQAINHGQEKPGGVALSLGGRFYQSLSHHSRFSDTRLLNQTLRYDIEEEFAGDADSIALCYQIRSGKETGSDLLVHTTDRKRLSNILSEFEQADLDAFVAEPDIASWIHYLRNEGELSQREPVVAVAWSGQTLYILALDSQCRPVLTRSMPCASGAEAADLLNSEFLRSLAFLSDSDQPRSLLYHPDQLEDKLITSLAAGYKLQVCKLRQTDLSSACAAGVAIGRLGQEVQADFRGDGLLPASLLRARRKALYVAAAALSFFLFMWIILMNLYSGNYQEIKSLAVDDMIAGYKTAYPGEKPPRNLLQIPRRTRLRLRDVEEKYRGKSIKTLHDSASNTLVLFFEALNKLPEEFDLSIDIISANAEAVSTFDGSVPRMKQLEELRNAIAENDTQLEIISSNYTKIGTGSRDDPTNRRKFSMPLRVIKKTTDKEKD